MYDQDWENRWQKMQEEQKERRELALSSIKQISSEEAGSLLELDAIELIGDLTEKSGYHASSIDDMVSWRLSESRELEVAILVKIHFAFRGNLVMFYPLGESGGLVTSEMTQRADIYRWKDEKRGMEFLHKSRNTPHIR
jgi:hypothetical protein